VFLKRFYVIGLADNFDSQLMATSTSQQDDEVTWVETNPDFTECFKQTVLIWVPCAFIALFSPLDVYLRSKSRHSDIPWGFLNLSRALVLVSLICLTFIDLSMMLSMRDGGEIYDVQIVSVSVKAGTFVSYWQRW
jgi:ATP-binding cassette, subfamily C (CFTR/MRP), member 1